MLLILVPCQRTIQTETFLSSLFKIALTDLGKQLSGYDVRIVHILHDEMIVEARVDIAGELAVIVKVCMEGAFFEIFQDVPFVVEPEIRDSWG